MPFSRNEIDRRTRLLLRLLKEFRAKRGLSQLEVARALDVYPRLVSKIETGERQLTFAETMVLIEFYGYTPQKFCKLFVKAAQDVNGHHTSARGASRTR